MKFFLFATILGSIFINIVYTLDYSSEDNKKFIKQLILLVFSTAAIIFYMRMIDQDIKIETFYKIEPVARPVMIDDKGVFYVDTVYTYNYRRIKK